MITQLPQGMVLNTPSTGSPPTPNLPPGMTLNQSTPQSSGMMSSSDAMNGIKGIGNFLFPIVGDVYHDIKGDSSKTFLQQAGDTALSALPFIPGLGEAGEAVRGADAAIEGGSTLMKAYDAWKGLSAVTKGAATGYAAGVASNISQGKGIGESVNPMDLNNIVGTLTGGIGAKVIPKIFAPFTKNLTQEGAMTISNNYSKEPPGEYKTRAPYEESYLEISFQYDRTCHMACHIWQS